MASSGFVNGAMKCIGSGEASTTAGDSWHQVTLSTTRAYSWGLDDSDSDALKENTNNSASVDPSSGTVIRKMTSSGQQTLPLQPCFLATETLNLANVTGDATDYVILFDTESYDIGSNYNAGTGTFTAPVTGKYLFTGIVSVTNLAAGHTSGIIKLNLTAGGIQSGLINPFACKDLAFNISTLPSLSAIVAMTAGDTATLSVIVRGGTKTVSVFGAAGSSFSGALIC